MKELLKLCDRTSISQRAWSFARDFLIEWISSYPDILQSKYACVHVCMCLCMYGWMPVFSIWKSLRVLQKGHIKIVVRAIYIYIYRFFLLHTLLFFGKMKICCDRNFLSKLDHRPLFSYIYILYYETILVWGLFSIWITNATYCL